jgi:hypothetical protein
VFQFKTGGKVRKYNYKTMLKAKKSKILVSHGEGKYLKDLFATSYVTVNKALNGSENTDLQRRIRKAAVERGGTEYQPLNK